MPRFSRELKKVSFIKISIDVIFPQPGDEFEVAVPYTLAHR